MRILIVTKYPALDAWCFNYIALLIIIPLSFIKLAILEVVFKQLTPT